MVREMASYAAHPIIFPLSNPTSRAEAHPEDLLRWTDGRAIIGTGSPFPGVMINGRERRIDQTNNAYIFPGMGLGIVAVQSTRVTDSMFMAAANALAEVSPSRKDPSANLLPPFTAIREVSIHVALATAKQAVLEGLCAKYTDQEIMDRIRAKIWVAEYPTYI
jgi:malate dehydrogenase (oxaloacetate-decarboxylating)